MSETGVSAQEWTDSQYLPRTQDTEFMAGLPSLGALFSHFATLPQGYDLDLDDLFELGLGLLLDGIETASSAVTGKVDRSLLSR